MRIIGGRARGLHLTAVGQGDPQAHLRPTSDRVREAIFNLLINGGYGNPLQGARVLDAFAGTGALGLEAISRGAESACFIENGKVALTILRSNIKLMRAEAETEILRRDATQPGQNIGAPFAVVFMDPPYAKGLGEVAIKALGPAGWIAPDALIVWEEAAPPCLPQGFDLLDQRKYGDTVVTIARTPGPAQA